MRELSSRRLIVAKGLMFLVLAGIAATLLLLEAPSLRVAVLIAILAGASCRFYYFLFCSMCFSITWIPIYDMPD